MAIKLRGDSIVHIFLLNEIIKTYMNKNNRSLLELNKADEMIIQKSYNTICDEIENDISENFEKQIAEACTSDTPLYEGLSFEEDD